jgi:hypothetical protein
MKKREDLEEDVDYEIIFYKNDKPKSIKCLKSNRVYKFPKCGNMTGFRYARHYILDDLYEDLKQKGGRYE